MSIPNPTPNSPDTNKPEPKDPSIISNKVKSDIKWDDILKAAEKLLRQKLVWGASIGSIGLIGYPLLKSSNWGLFFISLLLALSAFGVSFFIGTLFGMPKRTSTAESDYTLNNSLVEISEWLTKIIVGLGLVNLQQIPVMLINMAAFIKRSSQANDAYIEVFSITTVVYFCVFGLYLGYNYMRLVLSSKYKLADNDLLARLEKTEAERAKLAEEVKEEKVGKEIVFQDVNKPKEDEITAKHNIAKEGIDNLEAIARKKLSTGLISNPDDPQKLQWGGVATRNFRLLRADVKDLSKTSFRLNIEVKSTDPEKHPLKDGSHVLFAIHPSFGNPPFRHVQVKGGSANLELYSSGSFTVGAIIGGEETELELDLVDVPGVSDYFKEN